MKDITAELNEVFENIEIKNCENEQVEKDIFIENKLHTIFIFYNLKVIGNVSNPDYESSDGMFTGDRLLDLTLLAVFLFDEHGSPIPFKYSEKEIINNFKYNNEL